MIEPIDFVPPTRCSRMLAARFASRHRTAPACAALARAFAIRRGMARGLRDA